MLAPDMTIGTLVGTRVVATPEALDACIAELPEGMTALRFAPDEALLVGHGRIDIDDPDAIAEREVGFSAMRFAPAAYERVVAPRIAWPVPSTRPVLAQGRVVNVPVKIWLTDDEALVITPTAYVHELAERLR